MCEINPNVQKILYVKNKLRQIRGEVFESIRNDKLFIYHYTSPEGLDGILRGDKPTFYFSRYDALNDISEGNDVSDVFQKVEMDMYNNKDISEEFHKLIVDVTTENKYLFSFNAESIGSKYDGEEVSCVRIEFMQGTPYLCCFSSEMDSLPMWNYYVKGTAYHGYNVGIDILHLEQLDFVETYGKGYIIKTLKVIYDEKIKKQILKDMIAKMFELFCSIEDSGKDDLIKKEVQGFLNELRFCFKKQCFEHEKEVRVLIIVPTVPFKEKNGDKMEFEVKYRYKGEYIVPYIEHSLGNRQSVYSVGFDPMEDEKRKTAKKIILEEKMSYQGYSHVKIFPSDIPVRY
ncbi:MAG: hypothetical protein NC225_06790 [Clostridium sp.]|nr:hypothetical protein [Clostridium sp.]MCM1459197.1 hypothetical protein [Bacteroides sp.]